MSDQSHTDHPIQPEDLSELKLDAPKAVAAGLPSILSTGKHVLSAMPAMRGVSTLGKLNQKGGVDCPSCAWPDPEHRSPIAEYCENGAKAIAEEATTKTCTPEFFAQHSVQELLGWTDYELGKTGRLTAPMYLPAGATHYQPITWEDAFEKIADTLQTLNDPNEAVFYTSGRTSNEAAYLYQLFVRSYGTNNLPDCSNMCHESSGVALSETVGIGKGSVTLPDFYEAEVIMIMGQNPGTNHPRMLSALQKAKKNGAKIVAVNPIKETGLLGFRNPQRPTDMLGAKTYISDHYLQLRVNSDHALLLALGKLLYEREQAAPGTVFDQGFITEKTEGIKDYLSALVELNVDGLLGACGLTLAEVTPVVDLLADKSKIIICWAMGLTQHKNAVDVIKEVVNILLLKGSIGKPGAGTCPVRGHSNVQGDRTVGIAHFPKEDMLLRMETYFDLSLPRQHGYDAVDCVEAMHAGKAHFFMAMGGNFLLAMSDTNYTAQALRNCRMTVQVSTKLNRSHLVHGSEALILPCLGRTDKDLTGGEAQFVSVENSMGVVHRSHGHLKPVSDQLRSEPAIICGMAQAVLPEGSADWGQLSTHYDHIREAIAATVSGFEDYNRRVRQTAGFYLPNGARTQDFSTPSGKAHFSVSPLEMMELPNEGYLMMTIRSHDQFNTTIYGNDDRYRGIYNERRVVLMHADDIVARGWSAGQVVDLFNYDDGRERVARNFVLVSYDIPRGCIATYFPEANPLIPIKSVAKRSNTPTSKSVVVQVRAVEVK